MAERITLFSMADLDRLKEFIDRENEAPRDGFAIVLPPSLMVAMEKEAERMAITKVTRDADGAVNYEVVQMREGEVHTSEDCMFFAILRECRFIEAPRFTPEKPHTPKLSRAEHMSILRKFTGQDWRGRR